MTDGKIQAETVDDLLDNGFVLALLKNAYQAGQEDCEEGVRRVDPRAITARVVRRFRARQPTTPEGTKEKD